MFACMAVAYPGLVKGCTRNFAHAQIVGRCGFEYGRNTVRKTFPKTFGIVL